eukprot:g385.t1
MVRTLRVAALVLLCAGIAIADDAPAPAGPFYVCGNVGVKGTAGKYVAKGHQDGVPKYTNEHGLSIFRHNGYWYFGDLKPWPPVTHYRCVADCPKDEDAPHPSYDFETNPQKGKDPAPAIQAEACGSEEEL